MIRRRIEGLLMSIYYSMFVILKVINSSWRICSRKKLSKYFRLRFSFVSEKSYACLFTKRKSNVGSVKDTQSCGILRAWRYAANVVSRDTFRFVPNNFKLRRGISRLWCFTKLRNISSVILLRVVHCELFCINYNSTSCTYIPLAFYELHCTDIYIYLVHGVV